MSLKIFGNCDKIFRAILVVDGHSIIRHKLPVGKNFISSGSPTKYIHENIAPPPPKKAIHN